MEINSFLSLVTEFQQLLIGFVEVFAQNRIFLLFALSLFSHTSEGFFTVAIVSIEQYDLHIVHGSVTCLGSHMTAHSGWLVTLTGGPFKGLRHRL